nr:hypothetical protein [uncultured archaeon]
MLNEREGKFDAEENSKREMYMSTVTFWYASSGVPAQTESIAVMFSTVLTLLASAPVSTVLLPVAPVPVVEPAAQ